MHEIEVDGEIYDARVRDGSEVCDRVTWTRRSDAKEFALSVPKLTLDDVTMTELRSYLVARLRHPRLEECYTKESRLLDVDGEHVQFRVSIPTQYYASPDVRAPRAHLGGDSHEHSTMLDESPRENVQLYTDDELKALWRKAHKK